MQFVATARFESEVIPAMQSEIRNRESRALRMPPLHQAGRRARDVIAAPFASSRPHSGRILLEAAFAAPPRAAYRT